ncbi:AP-4 complex accessory subunit RUSC1 [Spea bombifrons]|uniref:AP-4 complex accessory subunit RUSC1 n=1 Tax=Spea bombifrons TaxID=233779 RepID=UPI00234B150A|nr:AP-4 complex accessory subunit RUSC1 [Spea bombifrons]
MLAPRNALVSNLNFVHLQHVSLGVHLSLRPELKESPVTTDPGEGGLTGSHHTWKGTTHATQVDANSNDPSVPCQCCDKHLGQVGTWLGSSRHILEANVSEETLSPCNAPGSPLSPSSPFSDSSSSSDFSFDESPSSMCFKEFSQQEGPGSPDEQPAIIPLDAAGEGHVSPTQQLYESPTSGDVSAVTNTKTNPITPQPSLNIKDHKVDSKLVPLKDSGPGDALDANSNAIPQGHPDKTLPSGYVDCDKKVQQKAEGQDSKNANVAASHGVATNANWLFGADDELLPGLPSGANSEQSHRKNITSFNELAQKRRRSTGWQPAPQARRDKSDWLIIFSPDREHPPVNKLTTTAFYRQVGGQHIPAAPAGKEVTTFRELKYRNELIKQNNQQAKAQTTGERGLQNPTARNVGETERQPKGVQTGLQKVEGGKEPHDLGKDVPKDNNAEKSSLSHAIGGRPTQHQDPKRGHLYGTRPRIPRSSMKQQQEGLLQPAIKEWPGTGEDRAPQSTAKLYIRGMADGGDTRSREGGAQTYILKTAPPDFCPQAIPSHLLFHLTTNQKMLCPSPPLPPASLANSNTSAMALLPQSPCNPLQTLPTRMSPLGAFSPPHRGLIPQTDTRDVSVLQSPLFPRKRLIPGPAPERGPSRTADKDPPGTVPELLMADGCEDSAQLEKKGLLVAVGSSVDKIISHFNSSRNHVQKAQLGDSRLSPELGYLLVGGLCPSLYSLLSDGLKPFQRDVITGRRRLSPWSLAEASVKADWAQGAAHSLFCRVSHLSQLQDPHRKFNAFIFGLLNTKQLDVWLSHLRQTHHLYSGFYSPSAFLTLAATSKPELHEELLLTLQPLSALTFHVDLLFEHHHLPLHDSPVINQHHAHTCKEPRLGSSFQQIVQWGGQLVQRMAARAERETASPSGDDTESTPVPEPVTAQTRRDNLKDSNSNWWEDLRLASRMYVPSTKGPLSLTRLRRLGNWDNPEGKPAPAEEAGGPSAQGPHSEAPGAPQTATCRGEPRKSREGNDQADQPGGGRGSGTGSSPPGGGSKITNDGSLVESTGNGQCAKPKSPREDLPQSSEGRGIRFGHLFGASLLNNREEETTKAKRRRPSAWLTPGMSVVERIGKPPLARTNTGLPQDTDSQQPHTPHHQRSLRALCDHVGSGEAELPEGRCSAAAEHGGRRLDSLPPRTERRPRSRGIHVTHPDARRVRQTPRGRGIAPRPNTIQRSPCPSP